MPKSSAEVRSNSEVRELLYKDYERSKKEVKAIYDSLITFLSESKSPKASAYKKIIIDSQKNWNSYAMNACKVELKLASEAPQGGDSFYDSCYTDKAIIRITELTEQYQNIKSDLDSR